MRPSRPAPRPGHRAFTLVEIMVVVVVIGLLAAIAIPAFQRVRNRSYVSRYVNDFRQWDSAFQRYASENGSFPGAAPMATIPAGMAGYLPESFTYQEPLGGYYQWTGPSSYVVIRATTASDTIMQMVDAALDDGDLSSGNFIRIGPNTFGYHIQ